MARILLSGFFNRPTLAIAEELIGCLVCRKIGEKVVRLEITEVEAYDGRADRASHAHRGKTSRNASMFGEAGRWYVYFTYGMHWMLNIVTGPVGYPAAVLIRGTREIHGPARITKFLKIGKGCNAKKANRKTGLWIERGSRVPKKIVRTPRIGVAYAGKKWAQRPYRLLLEGKGLPG